MEHPTTVTGKEGWQGQVEKVLPAPDGQGSQVLIRLANGQQVLAPAEVLVAQADGSFYLPVGLSELEQAHTERAAPSEPVLTVPVMVEELHVEKRPVETGRARVTKKLHEREEVVDDKTGKPVA
ncbi:MAG TPA: hypothetical protein VFB38_24815 [Chthonomonadaceae bacterium]|nr:hypothetical protein [Chthonomonadaceae bacterium]